MGVEGDPIQYQVNRNRAGWVVELVNNDGVVKTGRTPARTYPGVVAKVRLKARWGVARAREWMSGRTWDATDVVDVEVPPGESRYVEWDVR